MQIFTDKKGRNWTIVINVAAVQRVKAMLDVDLMDAIGGGFTKKLAADPALLANLLYVICEDEATVRGITDRKFGAALAGVGIAAFCALTTELVAFFPEGEKEKTDDRRPTTDNSSTACVPEDCWFLVWKHSAVLGIHPGQFTLRELCVMAKAKKKDEWNRTGAILAMLHNVNRDPKTCESRSADYFNPYSDKEDKPVIDTPLAFQIMKQAWCGGGK